MIISIFLLGCGEKRDEWHKLPEANYAVPPYARYLDGVKICLDAGHGGQGHLPKYKRGPTGLREAEVNLRVASYLREFLIASGAIVFMTRTDDSFVSIPERSEIANQNMVDVFISIHHNYSDDPETNYTSTWYHRDADNSPSGLDLARYIQQGVAEALRLQQFPPTGLYSDQLVVPSGFGVLRLTERTAVLCEASFYSNRAEEKRLKDKSYNRREAYGYFLGIARYVASGVPKGVLVSPAPESAVETKTPTIQIRVMDGLHERGAWMLKRQQVFSNSIRVKLDGVVVPYRYLRNRDLIRLKPQKPLSNGVHVVETELINYYGNHNWPGGQWFKVAPPAARMELRAWTDVIPPDGVSYVGITVTATDKDGQPIADDEPIHAQTSLGRIKNPVQLSKNGKARFYLYADSIHPQPGVARIEVAYKRKRSTMDIRFGKINNGIVQGAVRGNASETAIADATVQLVGSKKTDAVTDPNGHFFFGDVLPGPVTLHLSKAGYYNLTLQTEAILNGTRVVQPTLHLIAEGAFIGQVFVLDARYGGSERGTPVNGSVAAADLNLAVVKSLKEILELAGATVHLIREKDQRMSVAKRVATVNAIKAEGYYLRIDHEAWVAGEPSVIAACYPGNQVAADYLEAILEQFNIALFETPIEIIRDSQSREIRSTNKPALALTIRSIHHPRLRDAVDSAAWISQEAYAIFLGSLRFLKGGELPPDQLRIQVVDRGSQQPLPGARVTLDGTFPLVTNGEGKVVFRGIQRRTYRIAVHAPKYVDEEIEVDAAVRKLWIVRVGKADQSQAEGKTAKGAG